MERPHPQDVLEKVFGLKHFRRGQAEIIGSVLQGHDTLAVMPTGGGKSLCYQLPSVIRKGITIVVTPLISLMRDQVLALQEIGVSAGCIHSGQNIQQRRETFLAMNRSESYLLYLSPERIQKPGFSPWFAKAPVSLIAIDEAHCVSQWGPDFREDYYRLNLLRELRPEIPILASTATATPLVIADIIRRLGMREAQKHVYGFYRPNLFYQVEYCDSENDKLVLLHAALEKTPIGRVIVYCGTRKKCEELARGLGQKFGGVGFYHAGLNSEVRDEIQDRYEKGEIRILFATNAFGMGVDHPDVRLVVHYQMNGNIDSYYQEMGRAGRDGKDSTCLLLYATKDKGLQSYFITQSQASPTIRSSRWRMLEAMNQYAEGGGCRHAEILAYFQDVQRLDACGHCDTCDPKSDRKIPRPSLKDQIKKLMETATRKKARKQTPDENQTPLTVEQMERVQILKKWRQEYARTRDVPAFLVFSNKTMEALARRNPKSLHELGKVYGIGKQKLEEFGPEILRVIEIQ